MSHFKWRNGFTVGLTIGVIGTIFFQFWETVLYNIVYCLGRSACAGTTASGIGGDLRENAIWNWDSSLVSSVDTLAQWIMAILTVVAVVLLWQTLVQTNKAAVDAARASPEANDIMRREQRPRVVLEYETRCEFADLGHAGRMLWRANLSNKGRGAAYDAHLSWHIVADGLYHE